MPSTGYLTIYSRDQYNNGVAIADALKDSGGIPITGTSGSSTTTISNGDGVTTASVLGGRLAVETQPLSAKNILFVRATGAGTVGANTLNLSVANIGNANATFNGLVVEPGLSLSWDGGGFPLLTATIPYGATGTILIITGVSA